MEKKKIIISIIVVVLLVIVVVGATYAFFVSRTNEGGAKANSGELDINYVAPDDITGELKSSETREDGLKAISTVSLGTNSVSALFNMYVTPLALTNLNIPALKWEVEGVQGGSTVYTNSGDFSTASVNEKIPVVTEYELTEKSTTFTVYIWLDANLLTSGINDVSFKAKISVDSTPVTGKF